MKDFEVLHYIGFDGEKKHLCKKHSDEIEHVTSINCNLCLRDEISGLVLTNITTYNEKKQLEEDKKILSGEVSRLYQFLDELAHTLHMEYNIPPSWNDYTGRLKMIANKEKKDGT